MENEKNGAFVESLKRNNKQIKEDRAQAIVEDTEMAYKRNVEDLAIKIKRALRNREGTLDLAPNNAMSLVVAVNDFDALKFVDADNKLNVEIRDLVIRHNLAVKRYNYLFGGDMGELEEGEVL